jgi:LysR family transcriptional regulator, glycine cleavage system transcriptional activator
MVRRALPPLTALRAFEAFARVGSMTGAAEELLVSHGAVSRQVRGLEDQLGVTLVTGPRHQLRLTDAGRELAAGLSSAFDVIAGALPGAGPARELVVSCLGTLAMKWLIPRLPGFLDAHPGWRVRIVEGHEAVDFSQGGLHAAIRIEDGARSPHRTSVFMDHSHGPVMAPDLLADVGGDLSRVLALPRLYSETFRPSWSAWAVHAGVVLPPSPLDREFEHNSYMLEAAAAGLGVAVAPWAFAADDVMRGRLVAPFGFAPVPARYVYLRPRLGDNPLAAAFGDWLRQEGAASPKAPAGKAPPQPAPATARS